MGTARGTGAGIIGAEAEGWIYARALRELSPGVKFAFGLLVALMPCGRLRLIQPSGVASGLPRQYEKCLAGLDVLSWRALLEGRPVAGQAGDDALRRFAAAGSALPEWSSLLCVPLRQALLHGYPGVLQLYRGGEHPPFTAADVEAMADVLPHLERAVRGHRQASPVGLGLAWLRPAAVVVLDRPSEQRVLGAATAEVDPVILAALREAAQRCREREDFAGIRCRLADGRGLHWTYVQSIWNGLEDGEPGVIQCLQPSADQWLHTPEHEYAADPEMLRLAVAMRYMARFYRKAPRLAAIAGQANMSPFHFHRRFTELFGLTPKRFVVDCQIERAQELLREPSPLSKLAAECGFAHQSHFTSRFRQTTGVTPTRWRRMMGGDGFAGEPSAMRPPTATSVTASTAVDFTA